MEATSSVVVTHQNFNTNSAIQMAKLVELQYLTNSMTHIDIEQVSPSIFQVKALVASLKLDI